MHAILAEMVQYCDAALELILLRDYRQVEQEELESLLQKYEKQRDEIRGYTESANDVSHSDRIKDSAKVDTITETIKDEDDAEKTDEIVNVESKNESAAAAKSQIIAPTTTQQTSSSFMSYLTAKWDAWKGIDPITAKQNRLTQLSHQISQVATALNTSKDLLSRANSTLQEEITTFEGILRTELGAELKHYQDGQIQYHESNLIYWKDYLSWLDNPPKHLH